MIPYRANPLGISGGQVTWRNFYDSPIAWTSYNALVFSSYSAVRIEIDFTATDGASRRSGSPIFGPVGATQCPLFIGYISTQNRIYFSSHYSGGTYAFLQLDCPPGENTIAYTMNPGQKNILVYNGVNRSGLLSGSYPSYPIMGTNVSRADCTIQRLQVFGDDVLIWQATKAELTV